MTHDGLINPQGIVFGENAKLDIGGSFVEQQIVLSLLTGEFSTNTTTAKDYHSG